MKTHFEAITEYLKKDSLSILKSRPAGLLLILIIYLLPPGSYHTTSEVLLPKPPQNNLLTLSLFNVSQHPKHSKPLQAAPHLTNLRAKSWALCPAP